MDLALICFNFIDSSNIKGKCSADSADVTALKTKGVSCRRLLAGRGVRNPVQFWKVLEGGLWSKKC